MAHVSPLRTNDTPMLFLAALAALSRLPNHAPPSLRRRDLVRQMLKRGDTAKLSSDILDALTDELLQLSEQFPTFDVLLSAYDTAVSDVVHIATGLAMAVAGQVETTPLFGPYLSADGRRQIAG